MSDNSMTYVAGDLSGIQDYILGVKTFGKAQAKRLRARSFHVEIFEQAALATARDRLGVSDRDILVQGGGGFLLRTTSAAAVDEVAAIHRVLESRVFDESGGALRFAMGWGRSVAKARSHLEQTKRQPWRSVLCRAGGWNPAALHRPPVSPPCAICGHARAQPGTDRECRSCADSARLGERLTSWSHLRVAAEGRPELLRVLDVPFAQAKRADDGAFLVGREVPRHDATGELLTFEELARMSSGAPRLAVLKADVDDMGLRVSAVAANDPTLRSLREFSTDLHGFFSDGLRRLARSYGQIYTLFAGGDDLLLVGPWDVMLAFAGTLHAEFGAGPGRRHAGLTISAGIALAPYRVPVRHAVARAEELLDQAKGWPGKDRCAALGAVWRWRRHREILKHGDLLTQAIRRGSASRSVLQRLLTLLEGASDRELRAARWNYQVGRAGFKGDVRQWADAATPHPAKSISDEGGIAESAASLRYALLATRR